MDVGFQAASASASSNQGVWENLSPDLYFYMFQKIDFQIGIWQIAGRFAKNGKVLSIK